MITVIADKRNLTQYVSDLTYSTVDPGGFETCSFTIPSFLDPPAVGSGVLVLDGLSVLWEGIVEDPGVSDRQDQVSAVGYGALLKDNPYRMIYVDRALANWQTDGPLAEKLRFATLTFDVGSLNWTTDNQGLTLPFPNISLPSQTTAEAWYTAPPGCSIAKIQYLGTDTNVPAYSHHIIFSNTDSLFSFVNAGEPIMDNAVHEFDASTNSKYVVMEMYSNGLATTPSVGAIRIFKSLGVYGPHGLTLRNQTGQPAGVYPVDVALHALSQQSVIVPGVIDTDDLAYIASNVVYPDRSAPETVIDDMSKLLGWHWGVWESQTMFGPPRLDFRKRPSAATCVVSRRDCDNLEVTEQRSNMYDTCVVSYTDPDGSTHEVIVSIENPLSPGINRTLTVDGGTNTGVQAQALAVTQLELAQSGQRGGGSPTLPYEVRQANGSGVFKAHALRAGLDRIRISDLRDPRPSQSQFDTFRISRTEVTVTNGKPSTTVEIDYGADLLEVLQARLTNAAAAAGIA